jgi:hypothetical protein
MATSKSTAQAATTARAEAIEECYATVALIAGARGILDQLEDHSISEDEAHIDIDRLLGEAVCRLKRVPELIDKPMEAANG